MITAGASRVASGLLCVHAIAITPAGSMELVRSSISIASGLPHVTVRSAPAIVFSGSAQRSLTLWPARSRSRQATLYTESSDSLVASAAASIATGWSEPPGRPEEFHLQPPTEPCVNLSIYTARPRHALALLRKQIYAERGCSSQFPGWQSPSLI